MTTKEYLQRAYKIDKRIKTKLETILRLRDAASNATSTFSAVRSSGTNNTSKVEENILKYMMIEEEINKDIDELYEVKKEIINVIKQVPNEKQRWLLELKYINGKSWVSVSVTMGMSEDHVKGYLHGRALQSVNKIIFNKIKS